MAIGRPIELTPNITSKNISVACTEGQTEFTVAGGYRINEIAVYRNGVRLVDGRDFAATNGQTVTLISDTVDADDVLEFSVFDSFDVAGVIVSAASTQTLGGNLHVTGELYAGDFKPTNLVVGVITSTSAFHVGSALTANAAGDVETIGVITATKFAGNATGLTGAPNISAGTIAGSTGTFSGAIQANDTTDSTSTTSGSIIVQGGLGVAKNVYIGAGLSVAGTLTYEDVTNVDSVGVVTAKSGVNITGGQLTVGSGITMGIAGVATFSGTSDVHLHDNVKLNVGDSSDLSIYHDGTRSYIEDTNGDFYIRTTSGGDDIFIASADDFTLQVAGAETAITAEGDGAVTLSYNNSSKFATTNDGTSTTGIATATVGIDAAISVWTLGASGTDHYTFTGPGNLSATSDPTLNLIRGQKYTFKNRSGGHPFRIQSTPNGSAGTAYNTGVTNNDGGDGTNIIFDVPYDAPAVLYYQCTAHGNMGGAMYISGSGYETKIGAGITFGSAGVCTFADGSTTANALKFGSAGDLAIYNDGSHNYFSASVAGQDLKIINNGNFLVQTSDGDSVIRGIKNSYVDIYYDDSKKFETTNEGIKVTGFTSTTAGMGVTGGLYEGSFIKAGKLTDNLQIGIATANIFYFTTQETTTGTPNIRWDDTYSLSSKMAVGDVASVTVITTAAAGGYCANCCLLYTSPSPRDS